MTLDTILDSATKARVPVLLWGAPGVGKSAAINSWAKRRGQACWTVIASLREPADFGGLPVLSGKDAEISVAFAPPRFAVEASSKGGVIFLDELTTAPPAVQAALLRAVVDKAFGDLDLDPAKVTLIAAANPPEEAAGGWDLAPPLANRFTHQTYTLDPASWIERFPAYWNESPELSWAGRNVDEGAWGNSRSLVAAFVRTRPDLLLAVPKDESKRGQAWCSPRTWDFASRLLAATEGDVNDALPLISGCIGEGAALEFCKWARELDLPDPEQLLANPDSYRHPNRGDQAYAVLSAVAQSASNRLTKPRWQAAWQILAKAAESGGADVAAAAARSLARAGRPKMKDLGVPVKELQPFLPVLQNAGLI